MYNPKAKHSCSVVGCTDRYIASLPKSTTNWTAPPRPPDSHNQGWTGHRAYRAMPEGPMHIFGPVPPPSVVGRNGRREISRTSRRNSLFTAAPPPPVNNRDHPPSAVGPVVARAEFGSQSSPGHNTHPSKAHTHRRLTLTPARTYKVAPQFVVRQPFLPQT